MMDHALTMARGKWYGLGKAGRVDQTGALDGPGVSVGWIVLLQVRRGCQDRSGIFHLHIQAGRDRAGYLPNGKIKRNQCSWLKQTL